MLESPSGIVYVLLVSPRGVDRDERRAQLVNRCLVARDVFRTSPTVVGIATEHYEPTGFSLDLCYLHVVEWTTEDQRKAGEIRQSLGYFTKTPQKHIQVEEYPSDDYTEKPNGATLPSSPETDRFDFLRQKFPVTSDKLLGSVDFNTVGRQLALEGFENWEILGAACSIVIEYRIDNEAKIDRSNADEMKKYVDEHVETPYSLFPPTECFSLKEVRQQIRSVGELVTLAGDTLRRKNGAPVKNANTSGQLENCLYARTKDNFDLWIILFRILILYQGRFPFHANGKSE